MGECILFENIFNLYGIRNVRREYLQQFYNFLREFRYDKDFHLKKYML